MDPTSSLPPPPQPPLPPAGPPAAQPTGTTAKIVYVLYLLSLVLGVTSLVAVIMAYVHQGDAPGALRSHYRFQIRTFWIGLLYSVAGAILVLAAGLGFLVLLFTAVWLVVRCVKGLKHMERFEPYPNPATWLW